MNDLDFLKLSKPQKFLYNLKKLIFSIPGGIAGALEVLHVPGHTDDSCAFWCEQGGFALVGDAVYEGGPGLTVFPTGDGPRLRESIRKSILALLPDTMLLSGHSRPMTVAMLAASMR